MTTEERLAKVERELAALAQDCQNMGTNVDQILHELRQLREEVSELKRSQGLA